MACGCGKKTERVTYRVYSDGEYVGNVQARSEQEARRMAGRFFTGGHITVKAPPAQSATVGPSTLK